MMEPTKILVEEHVNIKNALDVLEVFCDLIEKNGTFLIEDAMMLIDFIQGYADVWHHGKEEDQYFPVLEKRGIPRKNGAIGVMIKEHEIGRIRVRAMKKAAAGNNGKDFVFHGRVFVDLLRQHIDKEDNVLFAMADENFLKPEDELSLMQEYAKVDASRVPQYLENLAILVKKYPGRNKERIEIA